MKSDLEKENIIQKHMILRKKLKYAFNDGEFEEYKDRMIKLMKDNPDIVFLDICRNCGRKFEYDLCVDTCSIECHNAHNGYDD